MKKITEMYLERVFNDMKHEDMSTIKRNLKRMTRPELVETLLTNTTDNVWISADSVFELVRDAAKGTFEKIFKITDLKSDGRDDAVKEYCFKAGINEYGDLIITIECDIEGLAWTSEEGIDYMVRNHYVRYSDNRKSERCSIPFRYGRKFTNTFNLNNIREHILKSE